MITYPETVDNRSILYLDIQDSLSQFEKINLTDWVVLVIEDNADNPILREFAGMCIDKDVLYVMATGKACSIVDDIFDETIVLRQVHGDRLPTWMKSEEDVLMTTWEYDFAEAFWFITSVACYEDLPIKTVLVANLTAADHSQRIQGLISNINKGWLPKD